MKFTKIREKKYLLLETNEDMKEVVGLPLSLIKDDSENEYVGAELPNPIPEDLIIKYPALKNINDTTTP